MVLVGKNPPANEGDVRDAVLTSGLGRSPGEGHGNPPYGQRRVTVYSPEVAQSWTQLK